MTARGVRAARMKVGSAVRNLANACDMLGKVNPGGVEWLMAYVAAERALSAACDLYESLDDLAAIPCS